MRPEEAVALPLVFVLGAVVGSFANVCIHRLPRGESVVTPRSRCPRCGRAVAARDNVPILSWLLLRARCRACGAPISPRYVLVETAVGAIFFAAASLHGLTPLALAGALLATAAVILSATDLEARVLPDEVTLGVLAIGTLLAAARDLPAAHAAGLSAFRGHLFPALAGAAASLADQHPDAAFRPPASWDPFAFTGFCEAVRARPGSPGHKLALAIQGAEWRLLFDWCARANMK